MPHSSNCLLAVDQSVLNLKVFAASCKEYEMDTARSFAEATEYLQAHPNLAVVLVNPESVGRRLLQHLSAHYPLTQQIIIIPEHRLGDYEEELSTNGMVQVVPWPMREWMLRRAVENAFRIHSLLISAQGDAESSTASGVELDTMRNRLRALEMENRTLREMSSMKDDTMLMVAHDVRSPLTVILGYLGMLTEREEALSEHGLQILERVQASSLRLLALVNNLLDLGAIEEGRMPLNLAPLCLGPLVDTVVSDIQGLLDAQGVRVNVTIQDSERTYRLDRIKIGQVLQNLLSNAVQFSPKGSSIELGIESEGNIVHFSVRDAGPGLTQEQIAHAFERFTRFGNRASTGSGLGLPIAQSMVKLHGGTIWIESEPDKGATFHFTVSEHPDL